jgi:integrase
MYIWRLSEVAAYLKIFTEVIVVNRRPAKVLGPKDVRRLLALVRRRRNPGRDRVIVLLSLKAGLRAGEIAALKWAMVTNPEQQIGSYLELTGSVAKKGSGRRIPSIPTFGSLWEGFNRVWIGTPIMWSRPTLTKQFREPWTFAACPRRLRVRLVG